MSPVSQWSQAVGNRAGRVESAHAPSASVALAMVVNRSFMSDPSFRLGTYEQVARPESAVPPAPHGGQHLYQEGFSLQREAQQCLRTPQAELAADM